MSISTLAKVLSLFAVGYFMSCDSEEISDTAPKSVASLGFWIGSGQSSQVILNYPDWTHDQELEFRWASGSCDLYVSNDCAGFFSAKKSITSPWQVIAANAEGLDLSKQVSLAVSGPGGRALQTSFDPTDIIFESSDNAIFLGSEAQVVAFPDPANKGISTLWMIGGNTGINIDNNISKSTDGIHWKRIEPVGATFLGNSGHQVAVMPDPNNGGTLTLWTIGGVDYNLNSILNDVFKSVNGVTWERVLPNGGTFSPRVYHSVVAMPDPSNSYKNTLWVFGGLNSFGATLGDIWKSTDGATWEEVIPSGDRFEARFGSQVKVMPDPGNNDIQTFWVISGSYIDDLWKSTDGLTWTRVPTTYGLVQGRIGHQVVVMKDKENRAALWLLGGFAYHPTGPNYFLAKNDIWKSYDGANWEKVNTSESRITFSPRGFHQVVVMADLTANGKESMWVIGGRRLIDYYLSYVNDTWKSSDGVNFLKGTKVNIQF